MVSSSDPVSRSEAAHALARSVVDALPRGYRAPLVTGDVRVLLVDAEPWQAAVPAARQWLDPAETARVARKRFAHDRDLLTLAYALHRLWLAHSLGCDPAAVPLIRDARGAPQLPGTGLQTSLSHADGAIAIAISVAAVVGIDIEPSLRASGMAELAGHICHPNELRALTGVAAADRDRALLRLWVRKEALLKAVGVGLHWDMASFEAPERSPILFADKTGNDLHVIDIQDTHGFVAAVATAPDRVPECGWLGSASSGPPVHVAS